MMKTSFFKANGIRFRICRWGSPKKPLLFFLHGWLDTAASFHFLCEFLKHDFHCVAPDLRGFGKSSHAPSPLGYFFYEYLADVRALLNHFSQAEPARLVGHSMGGNIGSLYAGTFPEHVSHLVNVEGFGIQDMPPSKGPLRVRAWIESNPDSVFKIYPSLKLLADRLRERHSFLTPSQAQFLAGQMAKKVRGGFRIAADPRHKRPHPYLYQSRNVAPFWQNISAKVINVIAAKTEMNAWLKSKAMDKELKKRLSHFPKQSRTAILADCGHMAHLEKPRELADLIANFVG